jgi:hypothetical protein
MKWSVDGKKIWGIQKKIEERELKHEIRWMEKKFGGFKKKLKSGDWNMKSIDGKKFGGSEKTSEDGSN